MTKLHKVVEMRINDIVIQNTWIFPHYNFDSDNSYHNTIITSSPFTIGHITDLFIWPQFLCFPYKLSSLFLIVLSCLCSILHLEAVYNDITYLRQHKAFWNNPSSQQFQGMSYFLPLSCWSNSNQE